MSALPFAVTVVTIRAIIQAAGPAAAPTPPMQPSQTTAAVVDAIKSSTTQAVTLGELARTCDAALDRDKTAIRDIEQRITEARNQVTTLQRARADANAHLAAARGQQPAAGDAARAASAAQTQMNT